MGGVLAVEKKVLPCYLRGWLVGRGDSESNKGWF
jgi:hypothetical protein